jgi:hypothetical protein
MCRRWTGSAFATLSWFPRDVVQWQGELAAFQSSPIAVRTHCPRCGTPLSLAYEGRNDIALTVGSMDDPRTAVPVHNYGIESKLRWTDLIGALPGKATKETW